MCRTFRPALSVADVELKHAAALRPEASNLNEFEIEEKAEKLMRFLSFFILNSSLNSVIKALRLK